MPSYPRAPWKLNPACTRIPPSPLMTPRRARNPVSPTQDGNALFFHSHVRSEAFSQSLCFLVNNERRVIAPPTFLSLSLS